jgi:hypothetical protein
MKKLIAKLSLLGLVAGLAASSYSIPAVAAVDGASKYAGPTANAAASEVIIIIINPDEYYWVEYYSAQADAPSSVAPALNDATFDR